jgi:hypothetical protein
VQRFWHAANSHLLLFHNHNRFPGGRFVSGNAAQKRSGDVEPCNSLSLVPIIGGKRDPLDEAKEVIDYVRRCLPTVRATALSATKHHVNARKYCLIC